MTKYEICRLGMEPFLPLLHAKVRGELKRLLKTLPPGPIRLLDVGGRQSHYTIGLPVRVTITDIPRESEVQSALNLGLNDQILAELRQRRSNLEAVILEDMTRSTQPSESFDAAVSIEVIEHVPADEDFIRNIARIIKPGGWLYLSTPNGDYVKNEPPNYNPDHVRHYTRQGLSDLLSRHFRDVDVRYGVKTGKYRARGLGSFNPRQPLTLLSRMACNVISRIESRGRDETPKRSAHLFAFARKA